MRINFTLILSICTLILGAQPTITVDQIRPTIGDRFIGLFFLADSDDYTPGMSGANQVYDFSGLRDSIEGGVQPFIDEFEEEPIFTFEILDPATVLNTDSFPDADFVVFTEIDFFGYFGIYSFIEERNNGFFSMGDVSISDVEILGLQIIDTTTTRNEELTTFLPLPFTFGDSYTTTSVTEEEDVFTPGVIERTIDRDSVVVDGYGTLITPFSEFDNTLRIITYTQSTVIQVMEETGMEIDRSTTESIAYTWYSNDQLAPLAQYIVDEEDPATATLLFYVKEGFVVTSTKESQLSPVALATYPNPTKDHVQLAFELKTATQQAQVELLQLNGAVIQRTVLGDLGAGNHLFEMALPSPLASGMYVLRLSSTDIVANRRILVR